MLPQHYLCPSCKETSSCASWISEQTPYKADLISLSSFRFDQTNDNTKELQTSSKTNFHNEWHCPVCLQVPTFPVETNCGHLFCGRFDQVKVLTLLCTEMYFVRVSLLNGLFCENEQEKQGQQIMQDIRNYNKRFSGQSRPFADYVYDMPLLLQMAFRGLFTMAGLMWIFYLRIAICSFGAIMCLTFPLDIIPETVNGILGTADDLTVVILLLFCMIHICQ
ncbi:E3 ubiquitin-protein ligase RNF170-like isoform X2 [Stegostoma tigrinum]|uniref:E3 ubiquitin-protein ligase RNF170-like isoform X2 n=1 Tax=Stegostoma tigrinum TaxID=3053191 RepID=UPI00202AE556|nr:E3 ubiquitin-protein ligase RNF170-like isoform X2 [Stegostoma tigrinum]